MSILSKNSCITVLDTYIQRSDHLHRIYKFLHIFSHVPISIQSIFLGVYVIYGPNIPITKDKRTLQAVVGALEIFWGLLSCSAYLLQYGRYSSEMQRAGNNLRKLKKLVLSEEDMEGMFVNILAHLNFIIQYSSGAIPHTGMHPSLLFPQERHVLLSVRSQSARLPELGFDLRDIRTAQHWDHTVFSKVLAAVNAPTILSLVNC